ncbi:hypothetical protein VTJ04DRAFT_4586 [Mycothermus thermophilus]|uniref:uncharacterized protein n=1 Tax=Humicola insolens TaxID=85995 RepID=UPI003742ED3C
MQVRPPAATANRSTGDVDQQLKTNKILRICILKAPVHPQSQRPSLATVKSSSPSSSYARQCDIKPHQKWKPAKQYQCYMRSKFDQPLSHPQRAMPCHAMPWSFIHPFVCVWCFRVCGK